jgi:zinc transporter
MTATADGDSGLVKAYLLDGRGGGRRVGWSEVRAWRPAGEPLWMHLDYSCEDARRWMAEDSGLDEVTREALLADDPRPRVLAVGDGLVIIVRGVNHNAGADPEDMISLRFWVDAHRLISLRHRRVRATQALADHIDRGRAPRNTGDMVIALVEHIHDRIGETVDRIDDAADTMETKVLDGGDRDLRRGLAELRRAAIAIRRHIAPQRDMLARLQAEPAAWLDTSHRARIRECYDRLTRSIEELDAARDRALVTQEELANRVSEMINQRLYALSLITALFLPLSFITGMLGVNLGGIPGTTWRWGFLTLCGAMVVLVALQVWFYRRKRWF